MSKKTLNKQNLERLGAEKLAKLRIVEGLWPGDASSVKQLIRALQGTLP